jgi:class 3 adenylate cyclase
MGAICAGNTTVTVGGGEFSVPFGGGGGVSGDGAAVRGSPGSRLLQGRTPPPLTPALTPRPPNSARSELRSSRAAPNAAATAIGMAPLSGRRDATLPPAGLASSAPFFHGDWPEFAPASARRHVAAKPDAAELTAANVFGFAFSANTPAPAPVTAMLPSASAVAPGFGALGAVSAAIALHRDEQRLFSRSCSYPAARDALPIVHDHAGSRVHDDGGRAVSRSRVHDDGGGGVGRAGSRLRSASGSSSDGGCGGDWADLWDAVPEGVAVVSERTNRIERANYALYHVLETSGPEISAAAAATAYMARALLDQPVQIVVPDLNWASLPVVKNASGDTFGGVFQRSEGGHTSFFEWRAARCGPITARAQARALQRAPGARPHVHLLLKSDAPDSDPEHPRERKISESSLCIPGAASPGRAAATAASGDPTPTVLSGAGAACVSGDTIPGHPGAPTGGHVSVVSGDSGSRTPKLPAVRPTSASPNVAPAFRKAETPPRPAAAAAAGASGGGVVSWAGARGRALSADGRVPEARWVITLRNVTAQCVLERELAAQCKLNEDLVAKLLPAAVAQTLRTGLPFPPVYHECAVVGFLDLKGSTGLVRGASLSDDHMLELFNKWAAWTADLDRLATECGVLKIETAGDSYLVVAFLDPLAPAPVKSPSPSKSPRISPSGGEIKQALAALTAVSAAAGPRVSGRQVSPRSTVGGAASWLLLERARQVMTFLWRAQLSSQKEHGFTVRTALHAGPVVAGLMGKSLPKFTVLGATVHFCARLQSSGQPGRIHLARHIADQLRPLTQSPTPFARFELNPATARMSSLTLTPSANLSSSPTSSGSNVSATARHSRHSVGGGGPLKGFEPVETSFASLV